MKIQYASLVQNCGLGGGGLGVRIVRRQSGAPPSVGARRVRKKSHKNPPLDCWKSPFSGSACKLLDMVPVSIFLVAGKAFS